METKNQTNLGFYNNWEPSIDTLTFLGSGALSCAFHHISIVEPSGLGILLASGANALSLAAVNRMLPAGPQSRYLKVCAIIAALALTTFSLPFLIGALGTHSFILLSSKGAIELVLIHLLTKVATYALFKTAIFFKDRFFFNFPKNTDEVNSLETPALLQIKEHLTSYPGNGHYISLPVQLGLNKKLIETGQNSLPLISFSELGKEWSREDLKTLHSQDLSQLPLHKKAAIAELFMHHHFPPQMRPYTRDEVPGIESINKKKKLSQARAQWAYLILRLNPTAPLSATINEQLYQKGLPPPRRDSIDLPIPVNQKSIENLKEVQIPWYFNLFSEKSATWDALPLSLQIAFNKRFSEKLPLSAPTDKGTSFKQWIPEGLTWKLVALAALIIATLYVVKSSFTDSEIPVPPKAPFVGTSLKLYETASRASASFVKETFTIPDWVKSFVVNRVENLAQPVLQASKIPAPSALIPFVPFNYPENFISSIVEPIKEIATKTISLPPTQNALVASITAAPSSSTNLSALALLSLGALGALYAIYKCSKSQIDQPNEDDLRALEPLPKKEQLQVSVPIGPKSSFVGVEYGDKDKPVQTVINIAEPPIQEFYQHLRKRYPELPVDLREFAGKVIRLNNPRIIRELEALNPPLPVALLEEAPPQEVQMIEVEADPRIEPNWEAFDHYVDLHCPGVDVQTARKLATEGIILIQKLRKNEPVEETNLDDQLVEACWGLMLHAITKNQAFVEGTIDIKDPEYRIFNFFFPALYGRSSSHYNKRAIPIENGKWRDYKHFGADLSKLPANKRTVMLGKIATLDGSHRTYIKMENWGANLNLISHPNAMRNFYQVIFHSLEFFESAAKKAAPSVFGEVGGGLNMKKEHMLHKDAAEIATLIEKIQSKKQKMSPPKNSDITEFGFQVIVPYFEQTLREGAISDGLRTHIEDFLKRIQDRYGNNRYQKGNETSIGDSILFMNPARSDIAAERVELGEDDFEEMQMSSSIEFPKDWEIASRNFLSDDYLLSGTVRTYADYLKETGSKFSFVPEFLYPAIIESNVNKESVIAEKFNLPF